MLTGRTALPDVAAEFVTAGTALAAGCGGSCCQAVRRTGEGTGR